MHAPAPPSRKAHEALTHYGWRLDGPVYVHPARPYQHITITPSGGRWEPIQWAHFYGLKGTVRYAGIEPLEYHLRVEDLAARKEITP